MTICPMVASSRLTLGQILDPTNLADDLTIVTIGLAYQGRALPLAWATVYINFQTTKPPSPHAPRPFCPGGIIYRKRAHSRIMVVITKAQNRGSY
jgi:hypothetical protein